jgi:hypothetical protein
MKNLYLFFLSICLTATACKKEPDLPCCDASQAPVIMVHGFLASGDTYANMGIWLKANNYCGENLYTFDWNTTGFNTAVQIPVLDSMIDAVLAKHQANKVVLMGHSAGTGLCYSYLSDTSRAAKVSHYVNLAGNPQSGPAGGVPTLNIWSDADLIVAGDSIPGATNLRLTSADHYEVATGWASFDAIYKFIHGTQATQASPVDGDEVIFAGKCVSLGENAAQVGAVVSIYETNPISGERLTSTPDKVFSIAQDGQWGPFTAKKGKTYEFYVEPQSGRKVAYYREGSMYDNQFIYLRTIPAPTTLAGILLSGLPSNDNQTVLGIFSANKAVINGRDQLSINGFDLATAQYAAASKSAIAYFLYDSGDGQTSGNVSPTFSSFPFLNGIDYFVPTVQRSSIELQFNGRKLYVPNIKSSTDGIAVAVFD